MRKKDEKKNNRWENLQGFRFAHRGLFRQPASASRKLPAVIRAETQAPHKAGHLSGRGMVLSDKSKSRAAAAEGPLWREDVMRWKAEGRRIIPENSMKAFRMAVRHGFGSELDVHLTLDGKLVVFHDANLLRMTGVDGTIEKMTWSELSRVRLLDTSSRIPLLEEVLDLYAGSAAVVCRRSKDARNVAPASQRDSVTQERKDKGHAHEADLHLPLIIELKAEGNVRELCSRVMETIDRYPAMNYCIESFDPRVVYWFRKKRPDVIRGQLTENFCRSRDAVRKWGYIMTFGMWCGAPDILSRPDFIASKFRDRKNLIMRLRHRLGVKQVSWTIKNHRQLKDVDREGGLSIFERFNPGESWKNRKDQKNQSDQEISG